MLGLAVLPALLGVTGSPSFVISPRHWDWASASQLAAYIEQVDRQGLAAKDYAPAALKLAIDQGDDGLLEVAATRSFGLLARDLTRGHVQPERRGNNFIASDDIEPGRVAVLIDLALARHDVSAVLDSLAPQDMQYRALKAALARLPPGERDERRALRVNLERLRWLPRDLGADRLEVNVPEYTLRLFRDGRETASFRVIVGKPSTPTPQFSARVTDVIINPSWHVPPSIIAESVGALVRTRPTTARARGYVWSYRGGSLSVTQRPGPLNALGQIKLEMPNPFKVYVHDTPGKALFDEEQRAFSHGCIRTGRPRELAAALLGMADLAAIDSLIAGGTTVRLALSRPMPIHVVYQTVLAEADGSIRYLRDPYDLDPAVAAELDDQNPILSGDGRDTECSSFTRAGRKRRSAS